MGGYAEAYGRSLADPEGFWGEAAAAIDWVEPWRRVLDDSGAPFYRWFAGGRLNTCWNALDRHVESGRAEQPALVWDSPVTGSKQTFTYRELRDAVTIFAGALRARGVGPAECVPVEATDPLYIPYTAGTTGQPKGIVRDTGGHAVALAWTMRNVYDVGPGEVYWAASDIGWAVGHSYTVYGPLFHGCTSVLYEGKPVGTPDAGAFWRVISAHGVCTLFTAPTAFRAIRQQDPDGREIGRYDLSGFRTLFLAGERCDPDTLRWAEERLGVPVIDHYWQTETGWPVAANCIGIERLPVVPGSPTR